MMMMMVIMMVVLMMVMVVMIILLLSVAAHWCLLELALKVTTVLLWCLPDFWVQCLALLLVTLFTVIPGNALPLSG